MILETSVNWKAFKYKYSDNPQKAFENLTYYLFCHEFNQRNGIFRYFSQPHIKTNSIQAGEKFIGFIQKYVIIHIDKSVFARRYYDGTEIWHGKRIWNASVGC